MDKNCGTCNYTVNINGVFCSDNDNGIDSEKCVGNDYSFWQPIKPTQTEQSNQVAEKIENTLNSLAKLLKAKNKKYGNSALEPINIFYKGSAENSILIRLDDKVSRIKNSQELRKNDVCDLMGYLTLLCVEKGWEDFSEMVD